MTTTSDKWLLEGSLPYEPIYEDILKFQGFVYLITNLINNKQYIGKKFFHKPKVLPVNGKRSRRKHSKVETDWRDYYGSNKQLLEDVERLGHSYFKREILHFCKTKSECAYYEAKEQFDRNVLFSDDYYNDWIMVKVRRAHLTSREKKSIDI
jgi:hypothetical protein